MPKAKGKKSSYVTRKEVKDIVHRNIEPKFYDHEISNVSVSTTGVINAISVPVQGNDSDERIGDRINVYSLTFQLLGVRIDAFNNLRVIFFRWMVDSANESPELDDILSPDSGVGAGVLVPFRNYNHFSMKSGKVIILYDKLINMDGVNQDTYIWRYTKFYKRQMKVQFNPTLVTGYGKIYVLLVSDSSASLHPTMRGLTRVQFRDG